MQPVRPGEARQDAGGFGGSDFVVAGKQRQRAGRPLHTTRLRSRMTPVHSPAGAASRFDDELAFHGAVAPAAVNAAADLVSTCGLGGELQRLGLAFLDAQAVLRGGVDEAGAAFAVGTFGEFVDFHAVDPCYSCRVGGLSQGCHFLGILLFASCAEG